MAIVSNKLALAALTGLLSVGVLTAGAANAESNGNAGPAMKMEKTPAKVRAPVNPNKQKKKNMPVKASTPAKVRALMAKTSAKAMAAAQLTAARIPKALPAIIRTSNIIRRCGGNKTAPAPSKQRIFTT